MNGGQFSDHGNTGADPAFVQGIDGSSAPLLGGDFHLTQCSSAIDGGDNGQATLAIDLDGNPRISRGTVDMGAYEGVPGAIFFVTQPQDPERFGSRHRPIHRGRVRSRRRLPMAVPGDHQ